MGQHPVDLLFLDIRMPRLNGLEFIRTLKQPPAVVFTTAYSEYAVTSYQVEAVDYLLKPITYERFQKGIAKFLRVSSLDEPAVAHTYFKVDGRLVRLEHADILFAQSIKDYILIHTITGNYITHMTMKHLAAMMPSTLFQRVHRSFLVNRSRIASISRRELTIEGVKIPVGENYHVAINNILF